jgi:uncharacterized membrane protein YdjX (TVP38/TMEM64 family)
MLRGVQRAAVLRVLWVLLVAALVPLVPFAVVGELPGERWLQATGSALGFGAAGAGLLALDVLLPIPSSVVGALLGGRLGFTLGFACAFAGLCVGNAIGYGLGRIVPSRFAVGRAAPDAPAERAALPAAPTLAVVFLSRPVPVFAEAVAITAGAARMRASLFFTGSMLGNAAYAAAMAGNGAALLPDGLTGPGLILPMALPVLAYLAWRALRRRGED